LLFLTFKPPVFFFCSSQGVFDESPFSSALIAAAFLGTAAQAAQALVPAQSAVNFEAKQMGVPLKGHFKKFDAQIAFDAAKPESSKIHFTVDTGSATMGAKETDAELPKADWFNVAKFPQATLTPAPSRLWAAASSRWTAR
jgi:polyisoprenoid-binding protein YceI